MKTSTFLAGALSLATAASAFSVQINATTKGIDNPTGQNQIITANLYDLNVYDGFAVTALQLVQDQPEGNPDAGNVECRPYRDADGALVGGLPFSGSQTSLIGTNTKRIGSIVCYATHDLSSQA